MRAIVDIPDEQVRELDRLRRKRKVPRTELIRQAIASYLAQEHQEQAQAAFGIWKDKPVDALAFQRKLRAEWGQ